MIHWVDRRFHAWGTWLQMGRGLGSAGLCASWGAVGRSNVRTSFVPIKSLEDSRCDDWVRSLDVQEQAIMFEVYCTPHTAVEHSRILKMSTRTLYARLHSLQVAYTRRDEKALK